MDFDQLFPGRFIKAGELNGKDVTLTIDAIRLEDLPSDKGGEKTRGVIAFKQTKKEWVLNRTNAECLKGMWGRDTDNWIGKRVTIYPAEWNGEPCIRVKGSPDLEKPVDVEVKLPKRKPVIMKMQATGKKEAA